jgi:histidine ammonia-lyase
MRYDAVRRTGRSVFSARRVMTYSPSPPVKMESAETRAEVELRPGLTPLAAWRAIYRGAAVALDPFCRPDVDAGAMALAEMLAHKELQAPLENGVPSVAELMEKGGDRLPAGLVRLFVALKLASLGQGVSGIRWATLEGFADFVAAGLLPAIPAEGVNDRLALACLFAALTGTGETVTDETVQPAAKALKDAGLVPLDLNSQERWAFLSGAQLTTAAALAGLFEAERIFRSALVAAALTGRAMHRPKAPLDPRIHRLYRQPGQIDTAATLRLLLDIGDSSARTNGENGAAETVARATPLKMGTCLDLLRQAGATLERAANAVTETRLVVWQSEEIVAGIEDRTSLARAADLIALALGAIGDLSRARTAALTHAHSEAERETGSSGFVARIVEQADATSDVRRLLPMAGTTALVIATELLAAARACKDEPAGEGGALDAVLRQVREAAPRATEAEGLPAGDLAAIAERVGSGALAAAAGMELPSVTSCPPRWRDLQLGGRAKPQ